MTIEEFYKDKKASASEVCSSDTDKSLHPAGGNPAKNEYITIQTALYSDLLRDNELLRVVVRILMDKRLKDYSKIDSLAAVLDLPHTEGGEA